MVGGIRGWLLFLGLVLAGCGLPPEPAVPTLAPTFTPAFAAEILPSPLFSSETLPATRTAVPTQTPLPSATPVLSLAIAAPKPTATFDAFGISQTIGTSVNGRPIESYRFGFGRKTVVLVGGIHGGYEWNTIVLAYEMIDYFEANPDQIPANISLYIVPSANPDGQFAVTSKDGRFTAADVKGDTRRGRLNGNQVDLNRNWACDWQPEGLWGSTTVSGGPVPFSEPETVALRTFFLRETPAVVLFWHSKANGIFLGSCDDTYQLGAEAAEAYGRASGYSVNEEFTAYPVTGDASDWLAMQNIPSFTVELKTHSAIDWEMNLAGVLALLDYYGR